MLNQIILVGRLAKDPELTVTESGKKRANITLAVPRNYKNVDGVYETDFLDCTLWSSVAESTSEYCKTGDMIGVKGRVQSRIVESPDGLKRRKTEIVAERVTFLTSNSSRRDNNVEEQEESQSE